MLLKEDIRHELYIIFLDSWRIYDSSDNKHEPIAERIKGSSVVVIDSDIYLKYRMENKHNTSEFTQKISEGLKLSFEKLVRDKAKEDGELIFCEDGKIIHVKAKELLKQQTK